MYGFPYIGRVLMSAPALGFGLGAKSTIALMNVEAKTLCAGEPAGGFPRFASGTKNSIVLPVRLADVGAAVPPAGATPSGVAETFDWNGRPSTFCVTRMVMLGAAPKSAALATVKR